MLSLVDSLQYGLVMGKIMCLRSVFASFFAPVQVPNVLSVFIVFMLCSGCSLVGCSWALWPWMVSKWSS